MLVNSLYPSRRDPFERQELDELQLQRCSDLREIIRDAAQVIDERVDDCPTKTTALRELEDALMHATKSIAME